MRESEGIKFRRKIAQKERPEITKAPRLQSFLSSNYL
jgi:hypothetical protein